MFFLTLEFLNLFFAGILAGMEFVIHYGIHAPTLALPEKPQILLRQGLVRRLRWIVPAFFVPTLLSGVALAVIDGTGPGYLLRLGALFAILIWILVRIVGTVRINSATLEWNPDSPPVDWQKFIGKVERFHIAGTWAAILAFVFYLCALAVRLS